MSCGRSVVVGVDERGGESSGVGAVGTGVVSR